MISIYVLFGIMFVIHVYFRYSRSGRLMAKIPGPKDYPLIGHMFTMYQNPDILFQKLREWSKEYGSIFRLNGFHYRTVHISKPEEVEVILSSTRYIEKDMPYTFLYNWLGTGLLVSNGKKWQKRRKLLTPAFHFNMVTKSFTTFREQTQSLLQSLESEVGKSRTEILPFINQFTLRTMCETSLGTKISDKSYSVNKYIKNVHHLGRCCLNRLLKPWYFIDFLYMISLDYYKEKSFLPDVHNFTKEIIEERRKVLNQTDSKEDSKNKIMIDILLDEERKGNINENGTQEEIDTLLFEGHDTTATALVFMIMRIANETTVQNLIYEELDSIFGDTNRETTIADLNNMKYLECCIKESLRLYSSVPFLSRYITEDITLAGYEIPKNTYCDIHIYDVHRNPEEYPEPEKFIPERFLPENTVRRHPYAYIPFSAGPRNCIGQKFALMEIKTVMSGIIRKYRLEPVTRTEDLDFVTDITLRVSHPIYVRFCQRITNS